MDFSTAIKTCFSKYIDFTGRAQRSEYWYFFLFSFLLQMLIDIVVGSGFASGLVSLGLVIPGFSAGARRLHDTGRTGWWQLLWLVPILGWIVVIIFLTKRGDEGENRFGHDPLDHTHEGHERHEPARHDKYDDQDRHEKHEKTRTHSRYDDDAKDTDVEGYSDENNPWVKARKKSAEAEGSAQRQIAEEKKRRIEPPKFGRDAAKKD